MFEKFKKINLARTARKQKTILIVIGVYFILCCTYYYFFVSSKWPETHRFLNESFHDNGFAISLSSSLLDDLLIFLSLSLIILVLTTKKISDYTHSEKVSALINGEASIDDQALEDFLKKTIAQATIYDKNLELTYIVTAYDSNESALRLIVEVKHFIANMCGDQEYRSDLQYWKVSPSDAKEIDEVGKITLFEVRYLHKNVTNTIINQKKPFALSERFEYKLEVEVSRKMDVQVNLNYFTWSKVSDTYDQRDLRYLAYLRCTRLTRKSKVNIINQLSIPIEIKIGVTQKDEIEEKSVLLKHEDHILPGVTVSYPIDTVLQPGEDIRVFFFKPMKGE